MQPFQYYRAKNVTEAMSKQPERRFLAGGTTLIDLMKLEVERPKYVIDVNRLPWRAVESSKTGVRVGALVTNSELAHHREIAETYRGLSEAILAGASAQLRNKATTGGNILQRTRCVYFRDVGKACNKRQPGSGCAAIDGVNRSLAVLGTSEHCIATNPSDMNVALAAFAAKVHLKSVRGERTVDFADFHLLPGSTPERETVLADDELISAVTLPKLEPGTTSFYLKLRDRASYEFALASVAVVARRTGGHLASLKVAMGGVGTKPWRVPAAEALLEGSAPTADTIAAAVAKFLEGAKPRSQNGFKIELARRCLTKALTRAAEGKPT